MQLQGSHRKWVLSVTVLAVIVPVSLAFLSFNGFFSQSPTPESMAAETVMWEIERPSELLDVHQIVKNLYVDEVANFNLTLRVDNYGQEDWLYGGDTLCLGVYVASRVENGFVKNVNVTLYNDTQPSQVVWFELVEKGQFDNLSVVDYSYFVASEQYVKSFVNLKGINKPSIVYFNSYLFWILRTANNESHRITVSSEITYYNGTAYKKVALPIVLRVIADDGNSFETARTIGFGNHTGFVSWGDDMEDYYKIWLDQNQMVSIQLSIPKPSAGLYLDLYFYSPDYSLAANSTSRQLDSIEQITYTINQSGYWYIQVSNPPAAFTLYTLSIETEQP
jgi:hypothetical protein